MIRHLIVTLALLLGLAASAGAQTSICTGNPPNTVCTGPVSSTMSFEWLAPDNAPTIAAAVALEPRVRVDGASTFTVLTGETCTGAAAPFTCRALIPAALVPVLNVLGPHTVTMTMFDPAQNLEGPSAVPFALRSPPAAPTLRGIVSP